MGTTRATDPIDPLPKNRAPRDLEHNSHFDITQWHHELHPQIVKECARNSLPKAVGRYFHPTHVHLRFIKDDGEGERWQLWSSRDHRKQRHVEVSPKTQRPRHGATFWDRLTHMRNVEYWNVSWWVAQAFTWGSVVWVVNAFTAFLPFVNSRVSKSPDITGWTAFVGATIFEIGSVLGILEAWNRDDRANFGWGISIHHPSTDNAVLNNGQPYKPSGDPLKFDSLEEKRVSGDKKWIYFSANSKYWREMGFLAAFFQLIGATIFWISGFTAIPQIQSAIEDKTDLFNGVFWTPQVVGGSGFIISSTFIMLEAQKVWWKPRITSVGWQVGVWNFIGAIGFTLCGALGYGISNHGAEYQSNLATFWGSWAFLIGSVIQWYESVNSI